jgi:iron complex transport system substrate-binding protein
MNLFRFLAVLILFQTQVYGQTPKRIVSLAPSLTKNIYFLGANDQLVGCTSYCTEALADQKKVVASAVNVNIEKTVSLRPDIVMATLLTNPETIEMLQQLGIQVELFPSAKSFDEICTQFIRIGDLTGKTEQAQQIVASSKKKVDAIIKSHDFTHQPDIFFQLGADPIFTVLPNTFMNDFITLPGGINIAGDMNKGTINRESVIAHNPDVIFIVTMGIIGQEEQEIWKGFKGMKAAEENRIFIIDADKACSPTPITFVETLETIVSLMQQ